MNKIQKTLRDSAALRWLMLILVSGLMFSTYWYQDFFSGLKGLMESQLNFTSEEFGRLIGSTTIANMFGMIIIGGIILDKWGLRLAGLLFGGLAATGAAVVALGSAGFFGESHSTMLTTMIIGRIMFGSGLEVVCVVCTRAVVKWFKGHELALAMAINVGIGRLGTALGMALSADIGNGKVTPAISFAATLIGLSLILFLVYLVFDIKLDRQDRNIKVESREDEDSEEFKFSDLIKLITNSSFLYIALLCVSFYAAVFPFIMYAPDLLVNKFGFTYNLPPGEGNFILFGSSNFGNTMVYIGLFVFGLAFSLIPANRKTSEGKMLSYVIILTIFIVAVYSMRETLSLWFKNGPKTASLIPLGTILFTPVFGNYVDRHGKAASLMILGSFLLIFAHISLSLFNNVIMGYLGLISLGIAFSLVPAAMWPAVAKIVAENRLGTAYAFMFTLQNWGLGLFFWGIGALLDFTNRGDLEAIRAGEKMYDYTVPVLMLVVCGVVSIYLAVLLKRADKRQGYGLEEPFAKEV
ncbi:MAG: MFS transporter [Prolixibacteraceae bacterium]|nr:MFS transporter [Prolixibacteraceae bacterium]